MKKGTNILVLSGIIFLCFSVWIESQTWENAETVAMQCYGGSLSAKMQSHFERMNSDLKYMQRLVHAQPDRILFWDQNNRLVEYHYAHQALWRNQTPIVFDVRSFNFEFRNESGNLLTQIDKFLDLIETIGYTTRIVSNERNILSNCKIELVSLKNDDALLNEKQVALAIPESHLLQ